MSHKYALTYEIKKLLEFEYWNPDDPDSEYIFDWCFKDEGDKYPTLYINYMHYDNHNDERIISVIKNIDGEWKIVETCRDPPHKYRDRPGFEYLNSTKERYKELESLYFYDDRGKDVLIGSDHIGFEAKENIKKYLDKYNISYMDYGPMTSAMEVSYYYVIREMMLNLWDSKAILICYAANGIVPIVANKYGNVRAAVCLNQKMAELARQHNDTNVLCIPVEFISCPVEKIVHTFLSTQYEGKKNISKKRQGS